MKEGIFEFLCTDSISLSEIMKVEGALVQLEELEVSRRESYLETKDMLRGVKGNKAGEVGLVLRRKQ